MVPTIEGSSPTEPSEARRGARAEARERLDHLVMMDELNLDYCTVVLSLVFVVVLSY